MPPPGRPLADGIPSPVGLARFADEPWVRLRREASPDHHDRFMATCRRARPRVVWCVVCVVCVVRPVR
ncbi:hypothetical protein Shyhy02_51210 [Streptomyces hygroscopicus subsp. hygroscopicus]|nr:hypothetical protein Shyhy02_51210 [Streptomyces hygroscopicus subsp. hygroscopicus]